MRTGVPSELSEPALASAHDLALTRLLESDLSDKEWTLFEGRLDGIGYVASCMSHGEVGVHAVISEGNERRPFNRLIRDEDRNNVVEQLRAVRA